MVWSKEPAEGKFKKAVESHTNTQHKSKERDKNKNPLLIFSFGDSVRDMLSREIMRAGGLGSLPLGTDLIVTRSSWDHPQGIPCSRR